MLDEIKTEIVAAGNGFKQMQIVLLAFCGLVTVGILVMAFKAKT